MTVATEVGTPNVKQRLAGIRATSLVPLEGKGNPKGNLKSLSTTQKGVLTACPWRGSRRPSVPLLGFYGSTTHSGIVAIFWLREHELGDHTTGPCGDRFVAVECTPYCNLGVSRFAYVFIISPKISLICWLASSDVSASNLRARSMADAVGTVAVVEELAISPPAYRTWPISAAAGERPVVCLATFESASFSLDEIGTCI